MKKQLKIPKFKSIKEELKFWSEIDLGDYLESKDLVPAMIPDLKPKTKPITVRLPVNLLNRLKAMANQRDIPYQSLMKDIIFRGISRK